MKKNDRGKFTAWRVNSTSNFTRKPDIARIHSRLNSITGQNAFLFCKPHQCANNENPFQSHYLANRKQDIFRMKTTFISTSWRKQRLIFYNLSQRKETESTKYGVFKAKILWKKIFNRFMPLPTTRQLGKMWGLQ